MNIFTFAWDNPNDKIILSRAIEFFEEELWDKDVTAIYLKNLKVISNDRFFIALILYANFGAEGAKILDIEKQAFYMALYRGVKKYHFFSIQDAITNTGASHGVFITPFIDHENQAIRITKLR